MKANLKIGPYIQDTSKVSCICAYICQALDVFYHVMLADFNQICSIAISPHDACTYLLICNYLTDQGERKGD